MRVRQKINELRVHWSVDGDHNTDGTDGGGAASRLRDVQWTWSEQRDDNLMGATWRVTWLLWYKQAVLHVFHTHQLKVTFQDDSRILHVYLLCHLVTLQLDEEEGERCYVVEQKEPFSTWAGRTDRFTSLQHVTDFIKLSQHTTLTVRVRRQLIVQKPTTATILEW